MLLPTAYCLLHTAYCILPTAYCLLHTAYCLLPTAYCLLHISPLLLRSAFYDKTYWHRSAGGSLDPGRKYQVIHLIRFQLWSRGCCVHLNETQHPRMICAGDFPAGSSQLLKLELLVRVLVHSYRQHHKEVANGRDPHVIPVGRMQSMPQGVRTRLDRLTSKVGSRFREGDHPDQNRFPERRVHRAALIDLARRHGRAQPDITISTVGQADPPTLLVQYLLQRVRRARIRKSADRLQLTVSCRFDPHSRHRDEQQNR